MTSRTASKTTTPDNKPFDFNLDAVQAESALEPFRFNFAGQRFTMAHLEALDVHDLLAAAGQGDIGMMVSAFKAALGEEYTKFRKVPLPQYKLKALFAAYQEHCGVESGESPASPTS